ncbi:MAG: hypothetical protein HS115_00635 [Spirochaetales bacterium]|nr:hypothetical protein [Spirochaetales bacterium]
MQPSTAVSDAVLALITWGAACLAHMSGSRPAAAGFALVALAASVGVLRFSILPDLVPLHTSLSAAAGQVGIPLIGLGFCLIVFRIPPPPWALILTIALCALFFVFTHFIQWNLYGTIAGAIGALAIIAAGIALFPGGSAFFTAGGALLLVIAGLVVGTKGELAGMLRIDVFHYLMTIAIAMMAWGLRAAVRIAA